MTAWDVVTVLAVVYALSIVAFGAMLVWAQLDDVRREKRRRRRAAEVDALEAAFHAPTVGQRR